MMHGERGEPGVLYLVPTPIGDPRDVTRRALEVLSAVLGRLDKENRLFRALMYDKQLAAQVGAFNSSTELSGTFTVMITPRPGQDLDEVVKLYAFANDR